MGWVKIYSIALSIALFYLNSFRIRKVFLFASGCMNVKHPYCFKFVLNNENANNDNKWPQDVTLKAIVGKLHFSQDIKQSFVCSLPLYKVIFMLLSKIGCNSVRVSFEVCFPRFSSMIQTWLCFLSLSREDCIHFSSFLFSSIHLSSSWRCYCAGLRFNLSGFNGCFWKVSYKNRKLWRRRAKTGELRTLGFSVPPALNMWCKSGQRKHKRRICPCSLVVYDARLQWPWISSTQLVSVSPRESHTVC